MLKQAKAVRAIAADGAEGAAAITYEQFLKRYDGDHVEWVDGEVVAMPPVSSDHSDFSGWLLALIRLFVQCRKLGAVRYEPFQMKTGPKLPGRSPDILFIAKKNLPRLKKSHLQGPADLVIEIISEGSRATDRGAKYFEYEQGGVREYWLIDRTRKLAEFYQLDRDGIYRSVVIGEDNTFRSSVVTGLWLKVDWLFASPLPDPIKILEQWRLV